MIREINFVKALHKIINPGVSYTFLFSDFIHISYLLFLLHRQYFGLFFAPHKSAQTAEFTRLLHGKYIAPQTMFAASAKSMMYHFIISDLKDIRYDEHV